MSDLPGGTTAECLKHFFAHFKWVEAQATMAEFCKVKKDTVRRWKIVEVRPHGDSLIKVRVFLDLLGYTVEEFRELPEVTRQLARLMAFNLVDADGVRQSLGYENRNGVFDLILRGTGVLQEKAFRLEHLVAEGEDMLKELVDESRAELANLPREGLPHMRRLRQPVRLPQVARPAGVVALANSSLTDGRAPAVVDAEPMARALASVLDGAAVLVDAVDESPDADRLWDGVRFATTRDLRVLHAAIGRLIQR